MENEKKKIYVILIKFRSCYHINRLYIVLSNKLMYTCMHAYTCIYMNIYLVQYSRMENSRIIKVPTRITCGWSRDRIPTVTCTVTSRSFLRIYKDKIQIQKLLNTGKAHAICRSLPEPLKPICFLYIYILELFKT